MKKSYVNVVADSGAAKASPESKDLRTIYQWVRAHNTPISKLRAQIRFGRAGDATWVKTRETAGRILQQLASDGG